MKKIFFFLAIIIASLGNTASAQTRITQGVKQAPDTATNADTVIIAFNGIGSNLKSLQASVYRQSGTAAGIVVLQYTTNGVDWFPQDTLTLTNLATNSKAWAFTATSYYSYRAWYKSTGTQTSTMTFSYLRRQDE
jgi:hypothetical protein